MPLGSVWARQWAGRTFRIAGRAVSGSIPLLRRRAVYLNLPRLEVEHRPFHAGLILTGAVDRDCPIVHVFALLETFTAILPVGAEENLVKADLSRPMGGDEDPLASQGHFKPHDPTPQALLYVRVILPAQCPVVVVLDALHAFEFCGEQGGYLLVIQDVVDAPVCFVQAGVLVGVLLGGVGDEDFEATFGTKVGAVEVGVKPCGVIDG